MKLPRVLTERTLTFSQAAQECPEIGGRKPSAKTIYAWCDTGILVGTDRVMLEHAKLGGKRVTSAEAIERFVASLTAGGQPPRIERTPTERRNASEKAMQFLREELGF